MKGGDTMKKILAFVTTGMLIFSLLTAFESPKEIDESITARGIGIAYELKDEDHGGLRE